ncbi:MAG TPA: tellurite resistance TerB family protein [Aestuariivirga sp.]|nr:tellurite resistance TerB family protein [Alphaproteobacteria bacterium]HRX35900.1 tellurite resistance TerB family protein [Aestuariivirga sp.]
MFDPKALLDQFLGGTNPDGTRKEMSPDLKKGLATGAAATGLAAILLGTKPGRKLTKSAVKVGGAAVLAGLAYKAYSRWQASKNAPAEDIQQSMRDVTPKPEGTPFLPAVPAVQDELSRAILRAMIAAAKADGHIDAAEQQKIFGKLDELHLDVEAKAWVMDELRKPLDIEAVIQGATSPEAAAEIYTASVLAIDPDDPAEQAYLAMLASRLKLDPGLKATIEDEARKALA